MFRAASRVYDEIIFILCNNEEIIKSLKLKSKNNLQIILYK